MDTTIQHLDKISDAIDDLIHEVGASPLKEALQKAYDIAEREILVLKEGQASAAEEAGEITITPELRAWLREQEVPDSGVDDETLARIGKAFLICAQYPEVFGKVRMDKFRAMFLDEPEEEDSNE